jgi:hypothetical protein
MTELVTQILCQELLVAEDRDCSGTQRKGIVRRLKQLPSNDSENVTMDNSVCVCVCVCECVCNGEMYSVITLCIKDRIDVAQDRNQWRALVNTVMNLRVP